MKFHTEVGDQTQYLAHEFNDNTIRFVVKYPVPIDPRKLADSVKILVQRLDILHSSFNVGILGTKWIVNKTCKTDSLTIVSEVSGDVFSAARQAALHPIDFSGEVQIRCCLFYNEVESALTFLVGHMCADGRDAAYLLKKLTEIYNSLSAGESGCDVMLKSGSRSINQCYAGNPEILSFDINKIVSEKSHEIKSAYRFLNEDAGTPCMVECTVSGESVARCRTLVENATVNDVILAAYYRAYVRQMELSFDTPVGIASMMDLRRYIPEGDSAGVANLSGPVSTSLPDGIGPDFQDTLSEVSRQTTVLKDDKKAGLDIVLAIQKLYKMLPFPLTVAAGEKIYSNMSIGLTNLGNLKSSDLKLENVPADKLIFAGPIKRKPALQLSVSGLDGEINLCIVSQCTPGERAQLENLLQIIVSEIQNA